MKAGAHRISGRYLSSGGRISELYKRRIGQAPFKSTVASNGTQSCFYSTTQSEKDLVASSAKMNEAGESATIVDQNQFNIRKISPFPLLPPETPYIPPHRRGAVASTNSPNSVWKSQTKRILRNENPELWKTPSHWQTTIITLQWWARQRPFRAEAANTTWLLWDLMMQQQQSDLPEEINLVLILNTTLDYWRLSVKENVKVPYTPSQVLCRLHTYNQRYAINSNETNNKTGGEAATPTPTKEAENHHTTLLPSDQIQLLPDSRSYGLVLGAMAYWKDADPFEAEKVLEQLLASPHACQRPALPVWNSVLKIWARAAERQWPEAASRATLLMKRMQEHQHQNEHQQDQPTVTTTTHTGPSADQLSTEDEAMVPMVRMIPAPDSISYTSVLQAWAHLSRHDARAPYEAQRIFDELREKTLLAVEAGEETTTKLNAVHYLHLLQAWGRSSLADGATKARSILQKMVQNYQFVKCEHVTGDGSSSGNTPPPPSYIKPNRHCFAAVMDAFGQRGQVEEVEQLLTELQELFERTGDEAFLASAQAFNPVLQAYINSGSPGRAAKAQQLLERLADQSARTGNESLRPDTVSVNTVLHAWTSSREPDAVDRVEALLSKVRDWPGVKPDHYTYSTIMKAWAYSDRPGAVDQCEALLRAMWEAYNQGQDGVKPNALTYGNIVHALSRLNQPDAPLRAEAVFNEMLNRFKDGDADMKPIEMNYVGLIVTWTRSRRREKGARAQFYFDQMRGRFMAGDDSLRPTEKIYNALLNAKKSLRDGEGAERALEQMCIDCKKGNLRARPTAYTFHIVLSTWASNPSIESPRRIEALLQKMKECHEKYGWDCKPTSASVSILLNAWAKTRVEEAPVRAESILRHMQTMYEGGDEPMQPTSFSYATVMIAWSRSPSPDAADRTRALFNEMMERYEAGDENMKPSSAAYLAVITTLAKSIDTDSQFKAKEVLDDMEARHRVDSRQERADCIHYSAAIDAFARKGDAKNAEALLQRIIDAEGIEPHTACFNGVLKAHARSQAPDGPEKAEAFLRRIPDQPTQRPDGWSYSICISAWQHSTNPHAVKRAKNLLLDFLETFGRENYHPGQTPPSFLHTFGSFRTVTTQINKLSPMRWCR